LTLANIFFYAPERASLSQQRKSCSTKKYRKLRQLSRVAVLALNSVQSRFFYSRSAAPFRQAGCTSSGRTGRLLVVHVAAASAQKPFPSHSCFVLTHPFTHFQAWPELINIYLLVIVNFEQEDGVCFYW